jgi:RNA polymerase sigma-70 factor (ECF subfamily)
MANTRRLSDASLVRRSQQGDRRAFGALVGRYDWRLRGLAHALLLDPAAMDEALSLAYLRAWRDIVRLTPKEDVGAWLYRATYNACIDRLRRDAPTGAAERRKGIRAGLAALTPADRVALVLVDREEFSPEAAARILGLTPDTLQERVEAAREAVAAHLPPPRPAAELPETTDAEPVEAPAPEPEPVAADGNGKGGNGSTAEREQTPEPEQAAAEPEPEREPAAEQEAEAEPAADAEVPAGVGSSAAPAAGSGGTGRPAPRRGRRARQRANRTPPEATP